MTRFTTQARRLAVELVKTQEKYQKLLGFVKECAEGEKYLNALCIKYAIPNGLDEISMKASDLLKEIGELE